MAKDESKLQIQLKIDDTKDREIFNVLKVTDSKSDFIKDALFHYVYLIEQGKVINRNYPYNKLNIKLDIQYTEQEKVSEENCVNKTDNKKTKEPTNKEVFIKETVDNNTYENKGSIEEYNEEEYDDNFDEVDI